MREPTVVATCDLLGHEFVEDAYAMAPLFDGICVCCTVCGVAYVYHNHTQEWGYHPPTPAPAPVYEWSVIPKEAVLAEVVKIVHSIMMKEGWNEVLP